MSDFDKFFAERLNEETEFPLREKNWKALAHRLDAAGVVGTAAALTALKYWKAAVMGLSLATGVLVWSVVALREENAGLREKIKRQEVLLQNTPVASADGFDDDTWFAPRVFQQGKKEETPPNAETASSGLSFGRASSESRVHRNHSPAETNGKSVKSEKTPGHTEQVTQPRAGSRTPDSKLVAEAGPVVPLSPIEGPQQTTPPEEAITSTPGEQGDSPADVKALTIVSELQPLPQAPVPEIPIPKPEIEQSTLPIPLFTKPYREKAGRFRVGVQGTVAVPAPLPTGISALKGVGTVVEYSPLRNVWLSASADWLAYQVEGKEYLPPQFFHEPQPKPDKPGGSNPPNQQTFDLLEVKGRQRMQFYNLGVRYALPVRFPLKPSVHLTHTWARFSPELYVFEFEDDKPGGPNHHPSKKFTLSASAPEQTVSSLWRIGAGLEYETRDWVFRIGADWVENSTASKPVFDAAMIQGTVLYKF
jgi:hypothetical protein